MRYSADKRKKEREEKEEEREEKEEIEEGDVYMKERQKEIECIQMFCSYAHITEAEIQFYSRYRPAD